MLKRHLALSQGVLWWWSNLSREMTISCAI